ncbi:hypothetical protein [Nostoc sp.]|uniref:hypothetical protein n=1 Tax=Nostoc sp. TaxID=1180 RepID=UPI002FFC775D
MRKSALILAIAPLVFAIAACGENSGQTASTPGTPGSTPAAPATRNRWASIKSRGQQRGGSASDNGFPAWRLGTRQHKTLDLS